MEYAGIRVDVRLTGAGCLVHAVGHRAVTRAAGSRQRQRLAVSHGGVASDGQRRLLRLFYHSDGDLGALFVVPTPERGPVGVLANGEIVGQGVRCRGIR